MAAPPPASAKLAAAPKANASAPASAESGAGATSAAPRAATTDTRAAEQALVGHDAEAIARALETLGASRSQAAATAVAARLKRGLPPQLIEQAIATLGMLGKPSAVPVLTELCMHRRAAIRAQALAVLGALKARGAEDVLVRGLDDPSAAVRVAAAQALAHAGNPHAIPALWRAADRGVEPALFAVASLARAEDMKPILERVKSGDLGPLKAALRVLLDRNDLSLAAKNGLIDELAKLATPSARALLVESVEAAKKDSDAPARQAMLAAVKRIDLAAKGELVASDRAAGNNAVIARAKEAGL